MARPQKEGLDYFPLDVDIDDDDKFQLLEAKHGITGFGVIIKLFMKIYKHGYYYSWTEKEQLLHSKRVNVDINTVNEIVSDAIKWGILDEGLYKKYEILTSNGIQKRYIEAVKRRNNITVIKDYWIYVDDNGVNVNINFINADIGTQRKEKNRIEKKSKGEYTEIFEKAYKIYPRPQAKQDTFNNWNKLLETYTEEQLYQFTANYAEYYKNIPEKEKGFAYSSNNFFGKKAYYQDFTEPKAWGGKQKSQSSNIFFDMLKEEGKL